MRLTSLTIEHFRTFPALTLGKLSAKTNIFVGPNGSGKTNILEAIGFLSLGTSFLNSELEDMVHWNKEHLRVKGEISSERSDPKTLEAAAQLLPRKQKAFFVNDVRTPFARFVGQLPTVSFLPEDLDLFTGSPGRRRTFLDQLLMQVSPEFHHHAREYDKVVKQRNTLLRSIREKEAKASDLDPWDLQIASIGAEITKHRLGLIDTLNEDLIKELSSLGEKWGTAQLHYVRKSTSDSISSIRTELQELLTHFRERDVLIGATTIGPHRDDWTLLADERSIATFASRGQQRTAILTLLFKQIRYLSETLHEQPVVLLDDVFSELDDRHQELLLKHLGSSQVFLTTTHLPSNVDAAVWSFAKGAVSLVA